MVFTRIISRQFSPMYMLLETQAINSFGPDETGKRPTSDNVANILLDYIREEICYNHPDCQCIQVFLRVLLIGIIQDYIKTHRWDNDATWRVVRNYRKTPLLLTYKN